MAKNPDPADQAAQSAQPAKTCTVQVLRAIAYGGTILRPGKDAKPLTATLPRSMAESFGPRFVKILD